MRALVAPVVIAIASCGDAHVAPDAPPPGVHELVACDQVWMANGFTICEGACVDAKTALGAMGPHCRAATSVGPIDCSKTFQYQNATGCCATQPPQVLFGECN
jgi:hypothetical protein